MESDTGLRNGKNSQGYGAGLRNGKNSRGYGAGLRMKRTGKDPVLA